MSLINIELWKSRKGADASHPLVQAEGCLVITFPDFENPSLLHCARQFLETGEYLAKSQVRLVVPLLPTESQIKEQGIQLRSFGIHNRMAQGLDLGLLPAVAAVMPKLKALLRIPPDQKLSIFRCTTNTLVRTTKNLAPLDYIGTPAMHGYTDQQPLNILSMSSVHAVSELLPPENQPLNALRFRANIYFAGASAFTEETWKRCKIVPKRGRKQSSSRTAPTISIVCRTSRCTMPNVIPEIGTFEHDNAPEGKKKGKPQPSTTLIEHRTPETGNKAALGYLGMHCVPEDANLDEAMKIDGGLYIEVGDDIKVLETGTHLYGSTGDDY